MASQRNEGETRHQEVVGGSAFDTEENMLDTEAEMQSQDMVMISTNYKPAAEGKTSYGGNAHIGTGRSVVSTQKDSYFNATSAQLGDPLTSGLDGYFNSEMD